MEEIHTGADPGYQYGVFTEKLKTELQNASASPKDNTKSHMYSYLLLFFS